MSELEIDAIDLSRRARRAARKTVELRVQYVATGVVGAAYNASTFANATPLLVLGADRSRFSPRCGMDPRCRGASPARGVSVNVLGAFPKAP